MQQCKLSSILSTAIASTRFSKKGGPPFRRAPEGHSQGGLSCIFKIFYACIFFKGIGNSNCRWGEILVDVRQLGKTYFSRKILPSYKVGFGRKCSLTY